MYLLVWPFGLLSLLPYKLFGNEAVFDFSAKFLSLLPGKVGQYLRAAFYKMTLTESHYDLMVGFCSFFSHPTARAGRQVGIGSFSIVGTADIGDGVLIASRVSVLSGKYQHGQAGDRIEPVFTRVRIGSGSWLGEGSVVMADIGERCVVSAGSVVTKSMPARSTAIGNPARFIQTEHFVTGGEQETRV
jgi:virginiamycin A acetyltransferase